MVEIDTENMGSQRTLQKRCEMQFEFPLVLKSGRDEIERVMREALTKYNTDFTFEVVEGGDVDNPYMAVRTGLDRIEAIHINQIRNEWRSTVTDNLLDTIKESPKFRNISEYQVDMILDSYTGPFIRVVAPSDPAVTDIGFYDQRGTPYIVVEVQSELSFTREEAIEVLAGDGSRFWLPEPPRFPLLDPDGGRVADSIFTDISLGGQGNSKNIILYSQESTSYHRLYHALDSMSIGGSNHSDLKPNTITVSCAVREGEL